MISVRAIATRDLARAWAVSAVEILFAEGDPFEGKVRRHELKKEIELAVLKNLVTHDEPDLSEREFQACVERARVTTP